jgi:hypothetical protein
MFAVEANPAQGPGASSFVVILDKARARRAE